MTALDRLPRRVAAAVVAQSLRGSEADAHPKSSAMGALALGALGVVYGDIGTNPLFALQEAFGGAAPLERTPATVLGVLSLVFWSLVLVVCVKYLGVIMRVSNEGEGGILALLALAPKKDGKRARWLVLLVLFGAALLYGDGVVTPAISVLSAVEGLKIAIPSSVRVVIPITVAILVVLFWFQYRGTAKIGLVFGPIMVLWFGAIAVLGGRQIVDHPEVLGAVDPRHALAFLAHASVGHIVHVLGAVVLTIAGGEALYADMGHFGRRPIQIAWYLVVFPALLCNYFGQGAHLLYGPKTDASTFFALVPAGFVIPAVVLATAATIIASQALVSGAYSLTQQAVQLGYFPRVRVDHTSAEHAGQIYVPVVNWALMLACVALVVGFGASDRLAAAYGLAVSGTMAITSVAYLVVFTKGLRERVFVGCALVGAFLAVDLAYLGANLMKLLSGGWVPIALGLVVFVLMTTWTRGRERLAAQLVERQLPLEDFVRDVACTPCTRVGGTGVFMTAAPGTTPLALLHNFKHNQVLHEHVVLLSVVTTNTPFVRRSERVDVESHPGGVHRVVIRVGFLERISLTRLFATETFPFAVDPAKTTYFLGRETLLPSRRRGMARWRKAIFAFVSRNAQSAPAYFDLPPNRVVELGMQVEI